MVQSRRIELRYNNCLDQGDPMSSAASSPLLEQPPLSETERVVDTFVAPRKTFTDIRRSASWWLPFLLMAISSFALVYVVDKKLGMEKVVENQMALSPKQAAKLDQLPPDQRAAQMETIVKFNRTVSYVYPVLALVFAVIIAAILLATFNFGFGAELKFKQCLAVTLYSWLPGILKALIAILAVGVGGAEGFTFQNPVASNPGALVDPSSHFLYAVAISLDLFTIWTLVLAGIGYSCLTKVKLGTCMAVVFGWWIIFVLGGAAIGAMFA
jgi:Yip1 domain